MTIAWRFTECRSGLFYRLLFAGSLTSSHRRRVFTGMMDFLSSWTGMLLHTNKPFSELTSHLTISKKLFWTWEFLHPVYHAVDSEELRAVCLQYLCRADTREAKITFRVKSTVADGFRALLHTLEQADPAAWRVESVSRASRMCCCDLPSPPTTDRSEYSGCPGRVQ